MIIFKGSKKSKTDDTILEAFALESNEVFIGLEDESRCLFLILDIETAIAFRKQLSKSIGYARNKSL